MRSNPLKPQRLMGAKFMKGKPIAINFFPNLKIK